MGVTCWRPTHPGPARILSVASVPCGPRLCQLSTELLSSLRKKSTHLSPPRRHLSTAWLSHSLGYVFAQSFVSSAATPPHFCAASKALARTASRRSRRSTANLTVMLSGARHPLSWAADARTCSCQPSGGPQGPKPTTAARVASQQQLGHASSRGQMTGARGPISWQLDKLCPLPPVE